MALWLTTVGQFNQSYLWSNFETSSLSYLSCRVLFVEWPTAIHEVPITFLTSTLDKTIVDLPYPEHLLDVWTNQNLSIKAPDSNSEFIPDALLCFLSKMFPRCHKYQLVLEVVFTQTLADILLKVGELLNAFPEILMVIVIDIMETRVYQAPATSSVAWNTFRQHEDPLGLGEFIPPQRSQKGMVINSGRHMWCSINSIDYHVWVKNGLNGGKIDVDVTDNEWYAYGVSLFNNHV